MFGASIRPGSALMPEASNLILEVRGLRKEFLLRGLLGTVRRRVTAVDNIDLAVERGETLGIVGESGSGKSTIGKSLAGIYRPEGGIALFEGKNLLGISSAERRKVARQLQYVHQNTGAALDPRWKVGQLLEEPLEIHTGLGARERRNEIATILDAVKLPISALDRYPHELSGGQQRRVGLARILTVKPSMIILDEATAGLDVSVQASIINLFRDIKREFGLTYLFISHDISLVRIFCDRVAVMYGGRIVEMGPVSSVINQPGHPYTGMLLEAVPRIGGNRWQARADGAPNLHSEGEVVAGCAFYPRCASRLARCKGEKPQITSEGTRSIACHATAAEGSGVFEGGRIHSAERGLHG